MIITIIHQLEAAVLLPDGDIISSCFVTLPLLTDYDHGFWSPTPNSDDEAAPP